MKTFIVLCSVVALCIGCSCPEKATVREGLWGVAEPSMRRAVVLTQEKVAGGTATQHDVDVQQKSYDEAKLLVEEDRARDAKNQSGMFGVLGFGSKPTTQASSP